VGDEDPQHFGAELQAIWVVAKEDIPPAAAAYRDSVGKLNNTRTAVDAAMRRPAYFAEDAPSVHDAWVGLHDTVTKFLSDTDSSLEATAQALADAAERYAADDKAAAEVFHNLCRQDGDPLPPGA
jgi:hypothetical protein